VRRIVTKAMRFIRRGRSLKLYLAATLFSVASTYYAFYPTIRELDEQNRMSEQQAALSAIEAARIQHPTT